MATPTTAADKHVHAKRGGGRLSHTHDDAGPGHAHDGLLPLPGKMSEPALVAPEFLIPDEFKGGEHRLPCLTKGEWTFDDYGAFHVGDRELDEVVRNFEAGVRRQDIPILPGPGINEDHEDLAEHPGRAIGWVKALERDGDRVNAVVEMNGVGDSLIANDQYRYVSPEILRDYRDTETNERHGMTFTGLALTNMPRLKSLGRIAASEKSPALDLIACSEGPASGKTPRDAAMALMAENDPDDDDDDDGNVPLCAYQPPNAPIGCCLAYTKRPGDTDGDGTCLLAERGCNGYRSVATDTPGVALLPMAEKGKGSVADPKTKPEDDEEKTTPEGEPDGDEDTEDEKSQGGKAKMSEDRLNAAEKRAKELEAEVAKLSESHSRLEAANRMSTATTRLDGLKAEGKVTPAQIEVFAEHMDILSRDDHAWVFDALDKVVPAVTMGEKGTAKADTSKDDSERIHQRALALLSERGHSKSNMAQFRKALSDAAKEGR